MNKSSLVFQGVGTGEYELGLSLEYAGYLWQTNGAPVKVIYPSDGSIAVMEGVAIIKNGPNTEEAKKFVDFINRKDIRELILSKMFRAIGASRPQSDGPSWSTSRLVGSEDCALRRTVLGR